MAKQIMGDFYKLLENQSFTELYEKYGNYPIVRSIIEEMLKLELEDLRLRKQKAIEKLSSLLSLSFWDEKEEKIAVRAGIEIAAARLVLDRGENSKLGKVERAIKELAEEIVPNYIVLFQPNFLYTIRVATTPIMSHEIIEKQKQLMAEKEKTLNQIKLISPAKYRALIPLLEQLDKILKFSVEDEVSERYELDLVNRLLKRIKDHRRYLGD